MTESEMLYKVMRPFEPLRRNLASAFKTLDNAKKVKDGYVIVSASDYAALQESLRKAEHFAGQLEWESKNV